ncbi:hypothetical protein HDV00_010149 [Rhizophlyctis rosea]|nr:hypothetical protein HDV00_010149 [Rhizophlyctis rosea]
MARADGVESLEGVVSCLNWNIIRGLVKVVLGYDDVDTLLRKVVKNKDAVVHENDYLLLSKILSNADVLHQSLQTTTRNLINSLPDCTLHTPSLQPAFPIYNPTGAADPRFRYRSLTKEERLHPIYTIPATPSSPSSDSEFDEFESADHPVTETVPLPGTVSVVPTISQFRRALNIFTMGTIPSESLKKHKAIVTGGAITACLRPWPPHVQGPYVIEQVIRKILYTLGNLPPEIIEVIESFTGAIKTRVLRTDRAIFKWLHQPPSGFASSDIDIFCLASRSPDEAVRNIPALHREIVQARKKVDLERFVGEHGKGDSWIGDMAWMNGRGEGVVEEALDDFHVGWWRETHLGVKDMKDTEQLVEELKGKFDDGEGWSDVLKWAVRGRVGILPTIRTANSVSVMGLWPLRETQLMLPVLRCGEEVVEGFDLDCVAVWWDGENVFATERAVRAFNTRTNFVDHFSVSDPNRRMRMAKYAERGFTPVYFESCSCPSISTLDPPPPCRHDVLPPPSTRSILGSFGSKTQRGEECAVVDDNDNPVLRYIQTPSDPSQPPGHDYTPTDIAYGPTVTIDDMRAKLKVITEGDRCSDRYPTCLAMPFSSKMFTESRKFEEFIARNVREWVENYCTEDKMWHSCEGSDRRIWRMWAGVGWKWERDAARNGRRRVLDKVFGECHGCGSVLRENGDPWVGEEKGLLDKKSGQGRMGVVRSASNNNKVEKAKDGDFDVEYLVLSTDPEARSSVTFNTPDWVFYDAPPVVKPSFCALCTAVNNAKRLELTSTIEDQVFRGIRCIVTGTEHNIAFRVAVTLARSGADVLMTSQVPYLTARRVVMMPTGAWQEHVRVFKMGGDPVKAVGKLTPWVATEKGWKMIDLAIVSALQWVGGDQRERCKKAERRLRKEACEEGIQAFLCGMDEQEGDEGADIDSGSPAAVMQEMYTTPTSLVTRLCAHLATAQGSDTKPPPTVVTILPTRDAEQYQPLLGEGVNDRPYTEAARQALATFLSGFSPPNGVILRTVDSGWFRLRPVVGVDGFVNAEDAETPELFKLLEADGDTVVAPLDECDAVGRVLDCAVQVARGGRRDGVQ